MINFDYALAQAPSSLTSLTRRFVETLLYRWPCPGEDTTRVVEVVNDSTTGMTPMTL